MNTRDQNTGRFIGQTLDKNDVLLKYQELKTLKNTAKYFGVSAERLRKFFIKNNLEYQKSIRYTFDENFFAQDNEESFYWAGFMAADGNVSKRHDIIIILKEADHEHLLKFKKAVNTNSPIKHLIAKEKTINIEGEIHIIKPAPYAKIRFRSHKMAQDLKRFNVIPAKTKTYDIPKWIIKHPLFHHFIRGYFDGDGWFSMTQYTNKKKTKTTSRISWGICGNKSVVKQIQKTITNNCDILGKPYFHKQINIYKLTYQRQHDIVNINNYLYKDATIYLDRKYELTKTAKILDDNTVILNIDKNVLQEAYNRLKSYGRVAKELGCCKNSVANYIRKYNIAK